MNSFSLRSLSLLVVASAAVAAQANLINNGSFETGDLTGWNVTSPDGFLFVDTGFSSEGNFAVFFGDLQASGGGSITQSIATVPGQKYTFSYDFAGDGDTPSGFEAKFGTTTVFSVTNPAFDLDYITQSYTVTATSALTVVSFAGYDDDFFINLDNVSVTAQAVPEPASLAALGLGAVAVLRRRRKA